MSRSVLATLVFTASLAGCASSPAPVASSTASTGVACEQLPATLVQAPSFSAPLQVVRSKAIHEVVGRQTVGSKRGAELEVLAQPGYDVSSVRRILACRADAARSQGSTSDPLAVDGVRVAVESHGPGYVVRLTAPDRAAGSDVWSRVASLDEAR